jgi:hypothetical protein
MIFECALSITSQYVMYADPTDAQARLLICTLYVSFASRLGHAEDCVYRPVSSHPENVGGRAGRPTIIFSHVANKKTVLSNKYNNVQDDDRSR